MADATIQKRASDYPKGEAVEVPRLPMCDICFYVDKKSEEDSERALFDGRTQGGTWANMCGPHFEMHGTGLGVGFGQMLIVVES